MSTRARVLFITRVTTLGICHVLTSVWKWHRRRDAIVFGCKKKEEKRFRQLRNDIC